MLDPAAKTPRRLQEPVAELGGRGGWGRAKIPVAPAWWHLQAWGAHTRGTWVWKNPRGGACFLQRSSGRMPALEVQRVGCLPGAPARHPADRPGARTGPRPGAWRRSPRASRYSGVWAFYPLRCGKLGGFVREWLGMRAGEERASLLAKPWHGGKTGMGRRWWERRGASGELRPSLAPETGAGAPARAGRFHVGGPRDAGSRGVAGQRYVRSPTQAHEHGHINPGFHYLWRCRYGKRAWEGGRPWGGGGTVRD